MSAFYAPTPRQWEELLSFDNDYHWFWVLRQLQSERHRPIPAMVICHHLEIEGKEFYQNTETLLWHHAIEHVWNEAKECWEKPTDRRFQPRTYLLGPEIGLAPSKDPHD